MKEIFDSLASGCLPLSCELLPAATENDILGVMMMMIASGSCSTGWFNTPHFYPRN